MWLLPLLLNTFYITLILLSIVYLHFKYTYTYWEKRNVPYLEPTIPFGNAKSVIFLQESFSECFKDIHNKLKEKSKYFGGWFMFSKPILLIIDPEIIKAILSKDFANFADREAYCDEENDPLSANLFALKGLRWKTLRAKLTPTFTSGKMKMMFHTILNCTKELGNILDEHIEAKLPLDSRELLARLATDTIASCAFGLESNALREPDNEFRKYGKKVFQFGVRESILQLIITTCPAVLRFFKIPFTNPAVTKFFLNIVNQTIEYREKNKIFRKDFLDLLIRLKNNQSVLDELDEITDAETGITFNELVAQAFIFFAAGFETSSSALNFCLYELCVNKDIQDKVRMEVQKVMDQHNGELSYEAVMDMKYMDKVFSEVLRKYPAVPMIIRKCTADYKMPNSNYICEKGMPVLISTLGLQRDPEYYPDPDKFDPERFSEEEKAKRHPFSYLPFGEGPRICIGMRFALLQVKIVLASLIKDYEFSLHPKTKTPIKFAPKNVFLLPVDTIWLETSKIM